MAMANLRIVETDMRIYRGIFISSGTIIQLETYASKVLESMGIRDFTSPLTNVAGLLDESDITRVRHNSVKFRHYTLEQIERYVRAELPATVHASLPVTLTGAEIVNDPEHPWRSEVAVTFNNEVFDEERTAIFGTLGKLAATEIQFEGKSGIRLGQTFDKVPHEAIELLEQLLPKTIELEPVEITYQTRY